MLYKKVDAASAEAVTAALDFFATPPTNCAVAGSTYREYLTLNPISSTPFNFKIHPINSLIDLSKVYVFTTVKLKRIDDDGRVSNTAPDDAVAPVQLPGATLFRNLKVLINQREVYDANQLYSYKAYLDAELSYPKHIKDSYLSVAGYTEDAEPNQPNEERRKAFVGGRTVQYISKLNADIFNQDLYLISNVEVDVEITPHSSDFMLVREKPLPPPTPVGAGAIEAQKQEAQEATRRHQASVARSRRRYELEIVDIRLMVKTVDLMDGLSLDIARKLNTEPARYGIRKTMLKSTLITQGRRDYSTNLFTEEIPRRVIIGLVPKNNFNGDQTNSPFSFEHFNVRDIELTASGRTYPQYPYNLHYSQNNYARAYHDMQEHLGLANTSESNGISYKMFRKSWCLYVFQLTNSQEDSPGFELVKDGATSVQIRFSADVPAGGVQLVAYGEADGLILIDRNRTITRIRQQGREVIGVQFGERM